MPYISQPNTKTESALPIMAGTLIDTVDGPRPVEALEVGDLVRTKDNGFQKIRWIAARTLDRAALDNASQLRPIRIKAGALGENKPERDLVVSPEHCILLDDWRCELLFGEDEMLAPARALLNDSTICTDHSAEDVTYYHFMFDQHEIVYSNGAETESFHPATGGVDALDEAKRTELFTLFPQLEHDLYAFGPQARAVLKSYEADVLLAM